MAPMLSWGPSRWGNTMLVFWKNLYQRRRLLLVIATIAVTVWAWLEWFLPPQPLSVWVVEETNPFFFRLLADRRTLLLTARKGANDDQGSQQSLGQAEL